MEYLHPRETEEERNERTYNEIRALLSVFNEETVLIHPFWHYLYSPARPENKNKGNYTIFTEAFKKVQQSEITVDVLKERKVYMMNYETELYFVK